VTVALNGSVIAPVHPVNAMSSSFRLSYRALKGKQSPERLEGEPTDVLSVFFEAPPNKPD
jgi:hypothetical protein